MSLGSGNSFSKSTKTVSSVRRIINKILNELWDFRNINWESDTANWDD
jgi:hypothetical protein